MIIFLTGMPGSGKSYWMRQLADELHYKAVDLDEVIVEASGKTIPALFAAGEEHFRAAEHEALKAVISQYPDDVVVATGGGTPCYHNNLSLMKEAGCVLYLETALEALISNIGQQQVDRPLLASGAQQELGDRLSALYRLRKEIYEQAHATIPADTATLATFADAIQQFRNNQNTSAQ